MSRADHMDVAAYALGVLDTQDAERFEEHLATCWACAAELETMVPVVGLLSGIDGETMMALEQTHTDPALLDRTLMAVRRDRRRTRLRQVFATAAAVVAFGALSGVGFATVFHDDRQFQQADPAPTVPTTAPAPEPKSSGPGIGDPAGVEGEQHDATDPGTGVNTTMFLVGKEYGTEINVRLTKLPGPRTCRLLVVRKNNTSEVVSTWSVPGGGYGTSTNQLPLELTASTAAARDDIAKIQVQSVDANGIATPLVTVADL
ncbi:MULTISPECIES: anti-sigma factor [Micromonospora]|uniref:RNA polymerase subunit sigma n=1 Tax=Micromonospora solifontis TaxID=2487138 RepID=A0ABX9WLY5_9ACTN|nr:MULTISPECIES: zf-HC2 domain-containing protein [Micromonospora]NES12956.1 RNA polymerase subunit sigma [Micromonospora sp. PPF5-17B]NES34726.1 RNA polymerase subunit sigma [Micromonospora solifontis]NES54881.1 RNA polymerase subunit sigma [Micromonospora sp. PPF5-6]RNM01631.1 RNA polymerase subunit sigma [Micromonospora solifontis]